MSTRNNDEGRGEIILAVFVGYVIYKVGKTIFKRLTDSGEEIVIGYEGDENMKKYLSKNGINTSSADSQDEENDSSTDTDYYYEILD